MFGRNKDKSVGFNIYGDVEKIYPLVFEQIEDVNKKLPEEMDRKMAKMRKRLPGHIGNKMNSFYMFMETLKKEDHVRVQVMGSDEVTIPFAARTMFKTMMGEARKITKEFLKENGITEVKIK